MNGYNGNRDNAFQSSTWAARNLNTILLAVVLFVLTGGLGWIARMGWDNSITLAEMKGNLVTHADLDLKIAALKSDFEIKIGEANTNRLVLEKDLYALKMALAERGITKGQK